MIHQLNLLKSKQEVLQEKYIEITNKILPALAHDEDWFIKQNHCFQRIILDNLFGCCWYEYLDQDLPAYLQLSEPELEKAISIAERIADYGLSYLNALNLNSLRWRGKI
jgi:hypothetical protein